MFNNLGLRKVHIYTLIFLIFSGLNLPFSFAEVLEEEQKINLSQSYLNKMPSNDYILGPGDKLKIIVSRNYPELDSVSVIDGEGTIYLPKLYKKYVEGLSVNELNSLLNEAFKKYVKFPSVEVLVQEYRPIKVFIKGEVENPGLITMEGSLYVANNGDIEDIGDKEIFKEKNNKFEQNFKIRNNLGLYSYYFPSIFDAIRNSGGITEFSDLSNVQIIRKESLSNGGGKKIATINFEDVLKRGDNSQNIRIYDGDIIVVGKSKGKDSILLREAILSNLNPKYINVFVAGRVNLPGNITLPKSAVLADAIDFSGGAKVIRGPVNFVRFNPDGSIDKRKFNFSKRNKRGSFKNPSLKNGDLIFIGNSPLSITNEIIKEITNPFVGIISTYGLIDALTD